MALSQKDSALLAKYKLDGDTRMDAAQTIFFARQLEEIDPQMYAAEYADPELLQLVSPKTLNPGAETYTYRFFDGAGVAKMTSDYASGSPRVDIGGHEYTFRIRGLRNSYGWNIQELRAAAMANLPLDSTRAVLARRVMNESINKWGLIGNAEFGIVGLFNQSSVPIVAAGTGGTGSPNTLWSGKTADKIALDLFNLIDSIPTVTKEREHARRVLLPYSRLRYIQQVPYTLGSAVTSQTVFQYVTQNRPGIEIRGALYLDTASAGGACRAMAYDYDRTKVEVLLPVPFESFPPERKGMEFTVDNHARMGSVVVRFPLSAAYMDAI